MAFKGTTSELRKECGGSVHVMGGVNITAPGIEIARYHEVAD